MAMWVVQAHREGRWAAWGPRGLDLVIQRSGMGTVPGCTRAGLPMVARRGSKVRGKADKGDKPRKGEAQRCAGVCRGAQKGARGGAQAMKGPGWQKSGSTWVPGSWKMGNWDGRACPNVAVQPGLEQVRGCRCSVEYCRRLMGGGGHIEGTPTIG